ncbi:TCP-1/cpn60 chaperonin family protein [Candidatus Cyanaurora vandensis]|uniref:TCP-1/cpn60 chaperonin family protein n=1 Tax=Candidatus Cyanaurora vandensis TaxID=2714958 RepID=UPI00257B7F6E|nr:TCP-1/cpn60 chaperonin family protein [Candidatus Cyanaurora vandensis]
MPSEEASTHLKVLRTNIAAVQVLVETVAGTLGPKGLDILLVDDVGQMVVTNDGIEILRQSDFQHPAARLAVAALQAQEQQVGDGTTTATVLTGALLSAALKALEQGVPVNLLLRGIQRGIACAITHLKATASQVDIADPALYQAVLVAARGDETLAQLVWQAAQHLGRERLLDPETRLGEWVVSRVGAVSEVIAGVVVSKRPLNSPLADWQATGGVLVLSDSLEPESFDGQTLATEHGFSRYLEEQQRFQQALHRLVALGVRLVVTEKGMSPLAESFCDEQGILALSRVLTRDRERICRLTGARPAKTAVLYRSAPEVKAHLGQSELTYRKATAQVILQGGAGTAQATIVVGALSEETAAEQERITVDSTGALQAALRSGVVVGGGVAELTCRRLVQALQEQTEDLSRYGVACVHQALAKPLEQIIFNSGYAPLEKVALVETAQTKTSNPNLGIDCETGQVTDLAQLGIFDPAEVKVQALTVAAEITLRILRIQTLIRRRPDPTP